MLRVAKIRMEYLENPVGLGELPWFGWILESDRRCVIQQGYRLQIGADEEFTRLVFDSGHVESGESLHVEAVRNTLPGTEGKTVLQSCKRYFVRVRVWDEQEESPFSRTASFVTGLLTGAEWKAGFISGETPRDRDDSKSTCLRGKISIRPGVAEAYACMTALGLYRLQVNGEKAGAGELTPGWTSYRRHLCYQTVDVTGLLRPGENDLEVMLGAGWYKGKMGFLLQRNNYGEQTAFLMQLTVRYRDGSAESFCADEEWEAADGPATFSEIYDGEIYDARIDVHDPAVPWKKVQRVDFPMEALTAQPGCQVEVIETLPARKLFRTPKGELVADFGQNLAGWVEVTLEGRNAGERVRLQCFEILDAAGNVYTDNLRTARQEIIYLCSGRGKETYHPHFTFMGFRYVHILEWPCEVKAEDLKALVLHSAMEPTGTFACSHPLVNRLQHNILWGLKGNFLDIPTDCPQRDERMGWTGDAQIFCRTACFLMNTYPFFRKWLKDVAADQTPEGGVPHVVPDIVSDKEHNDWLLSQGTHSAAAWGDVAVINPWTMYLVYGDRTILEEQYESMKAWIGFMREHAVDGIWNYRLQFGDWVALDAREGSYFGATPNDLTCTAYYAYSTGLFAKIARILGREEDAGEYGRLHKAIVKKFRDTFFDREGRMTAQTQTAHILALYFGLAPEAYREKTAQRLAELLEKEGGHLVTGFVGTPYFCHALSRNGYQREAYRLLLQEDFPSWLYQVKMGATTVWEHWDGLKPDGTMWSPDMNSFNHYAYGAVGDWLYRVVLGIDTSEAEPGYRHSLICPLTDSAFDWAEGSFESMYGRIRVRWESAAGDGQEDRPEKEYDKGEASADEEKIYRKLQITIPPNTTSTIRLEQGAELLGAPGLCFTSGQDGILSAGCGSGDWEVLYRIKIR